MKRLLMLAALITFCSIPAYPQGLPPTLRKADDDKQSEMRSPCKLSMSESPEIRGLKLGLTTKEFESKFPNAKLPDADEAGDRIFHVASSYPYGMELGGTRGVVLEFFDDKLVEFEITYDDSVRWLKVGDFVDAISSTLNLPEGWTSNRYNRDTREMHCPDFVVSASVAPFREARLKISERDILKRILERRSDLEKKRQKEFKP